MKGVFSALLAGVAFVAVINSAQAGFQWTAPNDSALRGAPAQQQQPRVQAAPVAPVMAESLPQNLNDIPSAPAYAPGSSDDPIMWNPPASNNAANEVYVPRNPQPTQSARAPQAPVQQAPAPIVAEPVVAAPVPTAPIPTTPNHVAPAASMMAAPQGQFINAEGFGSDLPLVMAIRQIVPSEFGFVFDEGINLGTNVSWQGGQPWNVVLQNVLTPLNLRAQISGTTVAIFPSHKASGIQDASHQNTAVVMSETVIEGGQGTVTASAPASLLHNTAWQAEPMAAQPISAQDFPRPDLHERTVWNAPRNSTLRGILDDWSSRAGVELYWASEYDYPVQAGVSIEGSFEEAVQVLLRGLADSKPRPLGRLHPNPPDGPAILVIETRDSSH